jgi:hypothetical protein
MINESGRHAALCGRVTTASLVRVADYALSQAPRKKANEVLTNWSAIGPKMGP